MSTDWQDRVVKERNQLNVRLKKLDSFINRPEFKKVDNDEQEDLKEQKKLMRRYRNLLNRRIKRFKND